MAALQSHDQEPEQRSSVPPHPADRPEDIAAVMVAKLSENKAAAVACAIRKALKAKNTRIGVHGQ